MASSENKLQEIIQSSLENIRSMIDANTVIGNPINTPSGTVIIPISKISMGFASGGLDFNGKNEEATRGAASDILPRKSQRDILVQTDIPCTPIGNPSR